MKRTLLLILSILSFAALSAQEQKEVVTGANYVNDIYYSLENGIVGTEARANWDIGFTAFYYDVNIIANNGAGVELYTWPLGDTADWASLDTTGMAWEAMYNADTTWNEGAFMQHATGHPDYGWGTFDMSKYIQTGDSLFVIKTVDGNFKKLHIIERNAGENTFKFRFANLDGTGEENVLLNGNDYNTKNFVYYSIDNTEIVDREPAKPDWDLLFTKYTTMYPSSDTTVEPYNVTGILANEDHIETLEVRESGLDQAVRINFDGSKTTFSSNISTIGYDWKSINYVTYQYDLIDTVAYIIRKLSNWQKVNNVYTWLDSTYYKIYFTAFTGMSEGKYTFIQEMSFPVSAREYGILPVLELYPNPASDHLNVVFDHQGEVSLQIIDMTGRTVYRTTHNGGGLTDLQMDIAELNPGLFFLKMDAGGSSNVLRFIKQ